MEGPDRQRSNVNGSCVGTEDQGVWWGGRAVAPRTIQEFKEVKVTEVMAVGGLTVLGGRGEVESAGLES